MLAFIVPFSKLTSPPREWINLEDEQLHCPGYCEDLEQMLLNHGREPIRVEL
jgi:hypothetical protein